MYPRPPARSPRRLPPPPVFLARVGSSRIERGPQEADLGRNGERFRARSGSPDIGFPMPNGVREIDSLNAIGVMDEQAHVPKSIFESVAEFRVAHGAS